MRDWTEDDDLPSESLPAELAERFTEQEKQLLKKASPFVVKMYSVLDQATLEAMLVGYLVYDPRIDKKGPNIEAADKIVEAGIRADWFETPEPKGLFNDLINEYKKARHLMTEDEMEAMCLNGGVTPNEASMYRHNASACRGTLSVKRISIDLCIERMVTHHIQEQASAIYKDFDKERRNPAVGPRKAWEKMRERCIRELVDARGAAFQVSDLIDDHTDTMGWLKDMKEHPEKYSGVCCGIRAIDNKTHGFRKGEMTVFVAPPGGYKTMLMLNILYGLYLKGLNVLLLSLEMEKEIIDTKIWCRACGNVPYSRLYEGRMLEPKDWDELKKMDEMLQGEMPDAERAVLSEKRGKLHAALETITPGNEDSVRIQKVKDELARSENKFKVITTKSSAKMKLTQLERWIEEQVATFKPDVVCLDYLALMDTESQDGERPDIGIGNLSYSFKEMGRKYNFAPITAAQLKRSAIERLHKTGHANPEKAQFGTADVADSNMIPANATNVFILWRLPGGTSLQIFTVKARHGETDTMKGQTVQIDHEACMINDNIESTHAKAAAMGMTDAESSLQRLKTGMPLSKRTDEDIAAGESDFSNDERSEEDSESTSGEMPF